MDNMTNTTPPADPARTPAPRDLALVVRFVFVGGSTAAMALALIYLLVEYVGLHTTPASFLAASTATVYNYFMHYHWTFSTDAPHGAVLVKYLTMCTGAVILSTLIMHFGVLLTNLHYLVIQAASVVAIITWSLTLSALWVFR